MLKNFDIRHIGLEIFTMLLSSAEDNGYCRTICFIAQAAPILISQIIL